MSIANGSYDWRRFTHVFNTGEANFVDFRILSESPGTVWIDDMTFRRHYVQR